MRKTVLVTGAFGFIGKYVTKELISQNYHVIALAHTKCSVQQDFEVIQTDIADPDMIAQVATQIKHCDILIHLAANLKMDAGDETI